MMILLATLSAVIKQKKVFVVIAIVFTGFTRNNLPISYPIIIMTIYAVYLGYRYIMIYA